MYQNLLFTENSITGNPRNLIGVFYSAEDSFPRAFGFLSDPNYFGIYMISVATSCVILLAHKKSNVIYYITLMVSITALFLSLSRSAFLALIFLITISLFLFLNDDKRFLIKKTFYKKLTLVSCLLSFIFLFFEILNVNSTLLSRIHQSFDGERTSYFGHINTRSDGLMLFFQRPFFGHGLDFNANPIQTADGVLFGGSHCFWLDILVGQGIVGGVFWMLFLISFFNVFFKAANKGKQPDISKNNISNILALSLFTSFLFANFMYHSFTSEFIWFLLGLLASNAQRNIKEKNCEVKE